MRPSTILVTALLCSPAAAQITSETEGTTHLPRVLAEMAPMLAPCVQPTTTSRVFTRCHDTHSSIHAHWAAYRIALQEPRYADLAFTSWLALEPAKLNTEVISMQYPYAAAWFLRLAIDFEKWALAYGAPDPFRLRPVGDRMAAWLKSYYDTNGVNPYLGEYANPAWALCQLHAYASFSGDTALAGKVQQMVATAFVVRVNGISFGSELSSPAFFSVFGNWIYVVAHTQPAATLQQFLNLQAAILDAHLAVSNVTSVHSYGLIWSRAWALRSLATHAVSAHDRARFHRAALEHERVGLVRHTQLKGNFANYDHWVPQFAVYAATEGL
ncbi:MAG: DUF2891 family protein [Planctomycetes bacterium]|nr:DUF2891 family protein [Planctomycetota bacterium]MCB9869053.1 DUF2891 family protein [Planctomycetota bacterium]MCB9888012.1 DUF2891 family protein [Planctomycetota bacterium]